MRGKKLGIPKRRDSFYRIHRGQHFFYLRIRDAHSYTRRRIVTRHMQFRNRIKLFEQSRLARNVSSRALPDRAVHRYSVN